MGSLISRLDAKIFLQFYENPVVKCTLARNSILFYNILLIFDSHKIKAEDILYYTNNISL
jgi:hypothetical protein